MDYTKPFKVLLIKDSWIMSILLLMVILKMEV